jgi:hypothetical protein
MAIAKIEIMSKSTLADYNSGSDLLPTILDERIMGFEVTKASS